MLLPPYIANVRVLKIFQTNNRSILVKIQTNNSAVLVKIQTKKLCGPSEANPMSRKSVLLFMETRRYS